MSKTAYEYFMTLKKTHKKVITKCRFIYLYITDNVVTAVRFRTKREAQSIFTTDVPHDIVIEKVDQPSKIMIQLTIHPFFDGKIFDNR